MYTTLTDSFGYSFEVEHSVFVSPLVRLCRQSSFKAFGKELNMHYWLLVPGRENLMELLIWCPDALLDQSLPSLILLVTSLLETSSWKTPSSFLRGVCASGKLWSSLLTCSHHFLPVIISWSSTQTSALVDFLYCSISLALVTLRSGQEKLLIQAADGELQLTILGVERNLQRWWLIYQ